MFSCWKSPEGVEEYKKLGLEYPTHPNDQDFESFMAKIEWDENKRETITDIIRIKTHVDKQFLVYSSTIRGQDQLLKNYDMLLEPRTTRKLNTNSDNVEMSIFEDKVIIGNMAEAYSIPFTKDKLEELHKKCVDNAMKKSVAAFMIASFFGGYNLGEKVTITQGINPSPHQQGALPAGVQPLQIPSQQQPAGAAPTAAPVKVSSIALDNAPTRGKTDAQVTFIEFSDFQCPFCESFFTQTEPQLLKTYVDTGEVKLVYKQFPMDGLHPNAREAALASECANEQGKFWPYHNSLFGNQTTWVNQNSTQVANTFKTYASALKLDTGSFNSCLDNKKYASVVDKDLQEGSSYGVSGTPTFYIGNDKNGYTQIVGIQPFSTFQQTIDQLVKQ